MTEIQTPKIDKRTKAGRALAEQERAAVEAAAQRTLPIDEGAIAAPVQRRATARQPNRETPRDVSRQPSRSGRVVVEGHNGEILSRKRTGGIDPFYIDPAIIPKGWEYQWNAISVTGNAEILADQNLQMAENGWRAVPSDRHPGRFMPAGHVGSIIRGGQRLDERPRALSDEARAEDLKAAGQLISDRNEALQLTSMRGKMPDGFEMNRNYKGTGGRVSISIDHATDAPRPAHDIEE